MKIVALTEAKNTFSSLVEAAQHEPIIVTKNGKTAVVMIHPKDDEEMTRIVLEHSRSLSEVLEASRKQARTGKLIDIDAAFEMAKEK
jgi:prevent-host-death family protein